MATRVVKILNYFCTSWYTATVQSSLPQHDPWTESPRPWGPQPLHEAATQGIILGGTKALCSNAMAVPVLLVSTGVLPGLSSIDYHPDKELGKCPSSLTVEDHNPKTSG